jgi:3-dehydroquinate synthase
MTTIRVAHAGADYEVIVGDLSEALPTIAAIANGIRLPIVSDARVFDLHGRRLADVSVTDPILVPEGEAAKDWATLESIIERLAALDVKRGTPIIAFGGGSVGDIAGLAASLFKRGCPIIHVPTTLLAQVDSAIGGKSAIDAAGQKNLVGTFHHPCLVVADPTLLQTLDVRQLRSGYAEVVKYGLISDPGFFAWCETHGSKLVGGDDAARLAAVQHCMRAKARVVEEDPEDISGTRALLNFGHTFGHAIESVVGHSILHGEAVGLGMALAYGYSVEIGICPLADFERVVAHFRAIGLPENFRDAGLAGRGVHLLAAMQSDKKATSTGLTLILARGIGQAFLARSIDLRRLADFLVREV